MEMKYFRGATNHKKKQILFLVINRNISNDERGMEEKKGLQQNADLHSFELP